MCLYVHSNSCLSILTRGVDSFFYLPSILPSTRDLTALNSVPDDK